MSDIRQSDERKTKRGQNSASLANLTRGSRKGIPNKTTAAAKAVIAEAAEMLGGMKRLAEWAKEHPDNEAKFWTSIYPKLIPVQVTGEAGGAIRIEQVSNDAAVFEGAIAGLVARACQTGGTGETQH